MTCFGAGFEQSPRQLEQIRKANRQFLQRNIRENADRFYVSAFKSPGIWHCRCDIPQPDSRVRKVTLGHCKYDVTPGMAS